MAARSLILPDIVHERGTKKSSYQDRSMGPLFKARSLRSCGRLEFVNLLHLCYILVCGLLRTRIVRNKAVVSFHAFPKAKLANVILQNAGTEIDVVLYSKQVDAFAIRSLPPGRQVNLHNANCIFTRNREWVPATFDDHDAGDQPRVYIVFSRAPHDGLCQAHTVGFSDFMLLEESIHPTDRRTNRRSACLNARFLHRLIRSVF